MLIKSRDATIEIWIALDTVFILKSPSILMAVDIGYRPSNSGVRWSDVKNHHFEIYKVELFGIIHDNLPHA